MYCGLAWLVFSLTGLSINSNWFLVAKDGDAALNIKVIFALDKYN